MIKSIIWVLSHPNNKDAKLKTLFRLVWWKVNQIFFKLPVIVDLKPGVKYIAYPDSSFGGLVVYTRLPEYYEMKYFDSIIQPSDIVIDIGVHMGDYSLLAASRINTGHVLSFEPSREALRVFNLNITINKYEEKITVYPVVASAQNGYVDFVDNTRSEISHIQFERSLEKTSKTKTVKIDDILSKKTYKKVKIAKIDVEGAELFVLRGMEKSLSGHVIEQILVEINSDCKNYGFTPEETINYLRSFGYKLYFFAENGKLQKLNTFPDNKKYINVIAKI